MTLENTVVNLLNHTTESFLEMRLQDLPIQPRISLEDMQLNLQLCTGFPSAFLQETLIPALISTLKQAFPAYQIHIILKDVIKGHRTQLPGKALRGVKNTIAIASGKGGVGKSTVAVNLAVALARAGARVGLLDADIYGPSIPLMLGKVAPVEIRDDHYLPVRAHGVQAMSIGYLTEDEPALIWRGPMLAKSLIQMLDITSWDELDYLFIDLPPGTGDIQLSLVQKIPLTGAVIVTTPQSVATLDAQKALKMFARTNIDVLGIIENMSLHRCSHCGHQESIFGHGGAQQLCENYHCKLLGQLPLHSRIRQECDQGIPTTANTQDELARPFIKAALQTAIEVARKPLNYADKFPPIIIE
ncbi:iron-sulfur cluster carrier protein ApbC [Legionella oakridgensis]|uniref:iron-sulfur cluster carrier protein ApbC n=1 Tax=Legionella oakridgensis TaxID=29423 RepID=UPI0003DE4AA5|nr:iron-sulfur cluster carrier protein ApbC [Legionella oakridgensis]ETO93690.1 ATPase involved in chromosome partitioning [Legionella oakridgensis RV-2-2007]